MPSKLCRILSFTLALAFILPYSGHANTATGEHTQKQGLNLGTMPSRGMMMKQVEQRFGQPLKRFDAVGKPPITRWQYEDMTIYFDHEFVIHAVATAEKSK